MIIPLLVLCGYVVIASNSASLTEAFYHCVALWALCVAWFASWEIGKCLARRGW